MSRQKRTPWFPAATLPTRNGWYETLTREPRYVVRRYWKDVCWYWDSDAQFDCLIQKHEWRGLQGDEHSLEIGASTYLVEFSEGPDRPGGDE